ncbi:MAG: Thiol-disulfide isomerase or thioredoxin [Mucilaginibacter sp.]|nr:Thiol-disulfide isomerase or thioredoxin [Mucilaginibacter sp.]
MKTRNLLILAIFYIIPAACFSQAEKPGKAFTLHGQIADPKLDSVSMLYINDQGKVGRQMIPVANGTFHITGSISQPTMAYILFIHKGEKLSKREAEIMTNKVFIEPHDMTIDHEADGQGFIQVKGSKSQEEWNELKAKTRVVQSSIDSLSKLSTAPAHGAGNDRGKLTPLRLQLAKINYDFFVSHPGSYVSANQVMFFTSVFSTDSLKHLYDNYTPEIKESTDARRLMAEIRSRILGLPGTTAFQFAVTDKDGKNLSLADFKGKYVLLDFWATWCVPCRAAMPHMIGLYQKYKNKNYDVIAIGDDDTRVQEWSDAIDHDGIGMFHHTLRGVNTEMTRKGIPNPRDLDESYGIHSLPTLILIDPNGKIIGRFGSNEEELDSMLASIFK